MEMVVVFLRNGAITSMEVGSCLCDREDADVRRQEAVEGPLESEKIFDWVCGEMDHLASSVDAGVGAPGGVCRGGRAQEREEGLFKELLDRDTVMLNLPSTIEGSIIGDD
jgi:hypothetical protein